MTQRDLTPAEHPQTVEDRLDYDALAAFIDKHRVDAGVCACDHWDKWAPLTFGAHIVTELRLRATR